MTSSVGAGRPCKSCGRTNHDSDAVFCSDCGSPLEQPAVKSHRRGWDSMRCHICHLQRSVEDPRYDFAVAKDVKRELDATRGLVLALLNAISLPFGWAMGGSLHRTSATLARCELLLCASCAKQRRGLVGKLKVSQEDWSHHHDWDCVVEEGTAVGSIVTAASDFFLVVQGRCARRRGWPTRRCSRRACRSLRSLWRPQLNAGTLCACRLLARAECGRNLSAGSSRRK